LDNQAEADDLIMLWSLALLSKNQNTIIISMDKDLEQLVQINKTKDALAEAGFGSLTCRKVFGRGKKAVNYEMIKDVMTDAEMQISSPKLAESISEGHRLIKKDF
jgi:hypothetical protein